MFCLIIHHRLRSALVTPSTYPVDYAKVLFCGKLRQGNGITVCDKESSYKKTHNSLWNSLSVTILNYENETVFFEIEKMNDNTFYKENYASLINLPYHLHEDIYDADESWTFVFSEQDIDTIKYLDGYRSVGHGLDPDLYINIKDAEEADRKRKEISKWFS